MGEIQVPQSTGHSQGIGQSPARAVDLQDNQVGAVGFGLIQFAFEIRRQHRPDNALDPDQHAMGIFLLLDLSPDSYQQSAAQLGLKRAANKQAMAAIRPIENLFNLQFAICNLQFAFILFLLM